MSQFAPDFIVKDGDWFCGHFVVERAAKTPPVQPTPQQEVYLNTLSELLSWLATLDERQRRSDAKSALRSGVARMLREDAEKFADQQIDATKAHENALIAIGRYVQGASDAHDNTSVEIRLEPAEANDPRTHTLATGIEEQIPDGFHPTDQQADIINGLTTTQTVLNAVRRRQKIKAGDRRSDAADKVLDTYLRRLAGIGHVGLVHDARLGLTQLDALQKDYLAVEAPRIRNRYVSRLFVISMAFFSFFIAAYLFARCFDFPGPSDLQVLLRGHKDFFLLAAGASIGTWLSFASRDQNLTFADLGSLDGDFVGPLFLVLFAIGFTLVVGLLLWTHTVTVALGGISSIDMAKGSVTLLIGLFCGLSERALATGVSGRAAAFATGVGGAKGVGGKQ